jgi:FlgD Ig-like domain
MRAYLLAPIVFLFLLSSVSYAQWQPNGVVISASTNYQTTQAIASDGAGGAIVTWHDFRSGTSYDIFAQRIDASGAVLWTADGVPISTEVANQAIPSIISDGAGGAIIAWSDDRTCCFNTDIYAQRIDASGAVLWTPNGVAICTVTKDQIRPELVSDGAGGAIIVWEDGRVGGLNTDVFAQRINAAGAVQWATNGVALCTAPNNQYLPEVVSDGAGGAIATWTDFRIGGVSDIFTQRVDASGATGWPTNGVKLSGPLSSEYSPVIIADGAGGAIVTWQDFRTGVADIYAQRINALGASQWTPEGVLISATGWETNGQIISDGAEGAIVTWHLIVSSDEFPNSDFDLYVQRVDASGTVQWTPDGTAISTAVGNQFASTLVSDGNGGAIIAWEDSLVGGNTNYDIRGQRVDASGATQWTPGGVAVCSADNEQRRPAILSDGAGGAIVAWEDFRNGSNMDIFAMQIDPDGTIPTGVGDTPSASAVALRSNFPNPFSTGTTFDLDLSVDADVVVDVYDVAGRRVRHEELGRLSAGSRAMPFDGAADDGRHLPSGVYFYRVSANGAMVTQKMVIAR